MRASRETLRVATASMQSELEARIFEGAWARVRRYFSDRVLARKLLVVKIAAKRRDGCAD
jgi:hypothetical protein